MANGQGIPSVYPPLVATENIADKVFLSRVVKNGLRGTFVIKGLTYKATMEGTNLTDKEIADVLNYVRNSWGNAYDLVTPEEVNTFLKQENETGK